MNRFLNAYKAAVKLYIKAVDEGLTKKEEENLKLLFGYIEKTVNRVLMIIAIVAGLIGICTGVFIPFKICGTIWILNRFPCDVWKNFKPIVETGNDDRFEVIDVRENWRHK